MQNLSETGGCPFHKAIAKAAQHGGPGLAYSKLRRRVDQEGPQAVFKDLGRVRQRALASSYTSEIFWTAFQGDHEVDHNEIKRRLDAHTDRYAVFLEGATHTLVRVLRGMLRSYPPGVTDIQIEAHERLTEIIETGKVKNNRLDNPESHLLSEIVGALAIVTSFCELIDRLYHAEHNKSVSTEIFKKILRSPEFMTTFIRIANVSEALISRFNISQIEAEKAGEGIRSISYLLSNIKLDNFCLEYEDGRSKDYPILHIKEGTLEGFIKRFDAQEPPSEPKVRCPAADLKVQSFYSEQQVSMVQATLEWYIEEVLTQHL